MNKYFRTYRHLKEQTSRKFCRAFLPFVAGVASVLAMTGCGLAGSIAKPSSQTPIISVAIMQAPPVSLTVGSGVPVSATVSNDPASAGVDWVATCGSAPLCGSFSPAHTASGGTTIFTAPSEVPSPSTIAVTAISATNHGVQFPAFVTIVSGVTSITITQPPPAFVPAQAAINLAATVVGDSSNLGVDWTATCGTTGVQRTPVNCGSFHSLSGSNVQFTVPGPQQIANIIGATITITARPTADHSFSASALSTVTALPTISITQFPPATMLTNATAPIAAVVTNDSTNSGVTWSLGCNVVPCGSISPANTASGGTAIFTAPPTVSAGNNIITITATPTAVGTASGVFATTTVAITLPLSVKITQAVATGSINHGASAPLIATVTNDPGNAGVDWTVSCGSPGACGALSPAHTGSGVATTFTAPSAVPTGNTVTITAASTTDPTQRDQEVVTVTAGVSPDSLLLGNFVILLRGNNSSNGPYVLGGLVSGDGLGNITKGSVDLVDASGNASPAVSIAQPSTYSMGPDGRGQIKLMIATGTLNGGFGVNGSGAITLSVVFVTPQHALLTEIDSFGAATGTLDLQNAADLASFVAGSWQNGTYTLALSGVEAASPHGAYSVGSAMTINFSASSYSYVTDQSDKGKITSVPFTTVSHNLGTLRNPNGELEFTSVNLGMPTQFNLDAWLIDANHFVITDWADSFSGTPSVLVGGYLTIQPSSPSVSGSYAFVESGATTSAQPQVAGGIVTCGSTGTLDVTPLNGAAVSNAPVNGVCTAPANGRGLIAISGTSTAGISQLAAYPTLDQGLYLIEVDGGSTGTSGPSGAGVARQQALAPIPASALSGKYAANFLAATPLGLESFTGQISSDGVSALSGTVDVNSFNASTPPSGVGTPSSGASLTGSFTAVPNGRFPLPLSFSLAAGQPVPEFNNINPACYIVDANTCLLLGLDVTAPGTGILQLQNTGL